MYQLCRWTPAAHVKSESAGQDAAAGTAAAKPPAGASTVLVARDYAAVVAATSGAAFVAQRGGAPAARHVIIGASLGCSQTCGGGALPRGHPPLSLSLIAQCSSLPLY